MQSSPTIADTCKEILQHQLPNLLRLYLNPYVAQTCLCLERYVQSTWREQMSAASEFQSFLANGFDEALSGAIKLARYSAHTAGRPTAGIVFDPADRLGPFAGATVGGGKRVEFVPGLAVFGRDQRESGSLASAHGPFGFIVVAADSQSSLNPHAEAIRAVVLRDAPLVITCVSRQSLAALRQGSLPLLREFAPDLVIFDESFADHAVPFSAFTARKSLYNHWNKPGKTTFHSTTYQPNTISSLHFMRCLAKADAEFHTALLPDLISVQSDVDIRRDFFRRLYSPSLSRLIRTTGFDTAHIRAEGDFIFVNKRRIFDAVSGVACSVRGHNPSSYVEEIQAQGSLDDCQAEIESRLRKLTGLDHVLPAVSGATAVENALKLALVAQFPKRHVLALKAGFGGKTLLALTGTANPSYKQHIEPLYAEVHYVDPFAPNVEEQIEAVLAQHAVAVVQVELIQAVGGVRRVPEQVIRFLDARKQSAGYLLLVDEVQTGLFRTGPFTLSGSMGLSPDLLLLGKGTSDMMFPFALVLYSAGVREKLDCAASDLPAALRKRYGYELGWRTVLNVLHRAEEIALSQRVAEAGALFAGLLSEGLKSNKAVRELRVFGLLIGIELDSARWPKKWIRKRLYSLYLYNMLHHRRYPVLVGFCQYEPNVLKITPSLSVAPEEIRQVCATITEVLRRPLRRLLTTVLGGLMKSFIPWRKYDEHGSVAANELAAR